MITPVRSLCFMSCLLVGFMGCTPQKAPDAPAKPRLHVSNNQRHLSTPIGESFFWLGGTSWGMSEWLTREEVDLYLENRAAKGFTVIQLCLFWGKRSDDPVHFMTNPANAYGFKAFVETAGKVDGSHPLVIEGGSPESPNDYWDHVEYIVQAAEKRGLILALLPVWGRRYVNATHGEFADSIFQEADMQAYGTFLGRRFKAYDHLIWVMGGDVAADLGGDFQGHYRAMAEGILKGVTGETAAWNEASPLWDDVLMTYHPDGSPMKNSSRWFHQDAWLDFHMIETFRHVDSVYESVRQDYALTDPIKPTIMAEPGYERFPLPNGGRISGLQMRRQAYHSLFAGAAGFTYGGFRDEAGNGPLFSPFGDWKLTLEWEGARAMSIFNTFCQNHNWTDWHVSPGLITSDPGVGEFRQVAVQIGSEDGMLLYFPNNRPADLNIKQAFSETEQVSLTWFDPASGTYTDQEILTLTQSTYTLGPPENWQDAILCISRGRQDNSSK